MTPITIGYARCSTDKQDLAAQIAALEKLGVPPERIYTDHGLTGTNRARPGLDQALASAFLPWAPCIWLFLFRFQRNVKRRAEGDSQDFSFLTLFLKFFILNFLLLLRAKMSLYRGTKIQDTLMG